MIGGLNEINRLASKGKREDREPGPRPRSCGLGHPDRPALPALSRPAGPLAPMFTKTGQEARGETRVT